MHVVVVGAGIIGMTTAWFLQRLGCEVTVVEQRGEAAMEASFANGSFYSAGLSAPWAAPGAIGMAIRSQFSRSAAFQWKPDWTSRQLRWIVQSMKECSPTRFSGNRVRITRLAHYSRDCLGEIETTEGIPYDAGAGGILQLYRAPVGEAMLQGHVRHLVAMDIAFKVLNRQQVFDMEPALAVSSPELFGALHLPDDSTGDCRKFCLALGHAVVAGKGHMRWNTTIDSIEVDKRNDRSGRLRALVAGGNRIEADAYVFAAGAFSPSLLRGIVDLPVYPLKGYSMSAAVQSPDKAPRHSIFDFEHKIGIARLGDTVRVSGIVEVAGHNRRLAPHRCAQLARQFEDVFPGAVANEGHQFWTGLRPSTPDGVPIISRSVLDNLFINTGHGGCGWSLSCGSAKLMADIVMGRRTELDAADYSLVR